MNKVLDVNGGITIYYQKAKFFRNLETHEFVYCIEPFRFFQSGTSDYYPTITPSNLTEKQIERINKIAHFGYNYLNHTEPKWYAIAQLMIWQEADPYNEFYFTEGPNGRRIEPFNAEIEEINNLIKEYDKVPDIHNEYTIYEKEKLVIIDNDNILKNYHSNNSEVSIKNNSIIISPLKKGEYEFTLYKDDQIYNRPTILYQSPTSQNLMEVGDIYYSDLKIKVKVINPTITVIKEDKETNLKPQGEAKLNGTIITLYDHEKNIIDEFEIKDNKVIIDYLDLGTYYIEETIPGEGYIKNNEIIEIILDEENNEKEILIKNEVIKKEIKIIKSYGENNNFEKEKDIEFEIYDNNNNLIETIKTNELGEASIILPYGNYTFIQKNTTEGYIKINPFDVKVENTLEETIELKDYKIPVPDTKTSYIKYFILKLLLTLLW